MKSCNWLMFRKVQAHTPVATAIHQFVGNVDSTITLKDVKKYQGHGLKAYVNGKELSCNFKPMDKFYFLV